MASLFSVKAPGQDIQEPKISLSVTFGKSFYSPTERINAHIRINNQSQETISGVSIKLEVGPVQKLGEEKKNWPRTLNRQQYIGLVEPGQKELDIESDLALLSLAEGVYPVTVSMFRWGKVYSETEVPLVLMSQANRAPLQVVFAWNYHEKAHFEPGGLYADEEIIKSFQRFPQKPGYLSNFISALDKHPKIKTSTHISPLLLEQIMDMGNGYKLKTEDGEKNIDSESNQASQARQIIDDIKKKIESKQLEVLSSPYGYASLGDLADRDWDSDGVIQNERGITIIKNTFELESQTEGFYCPDQILTGHSIKYLTENDVQYTILSQLIFDTIVINTPDHFVPFQVQDINNNKLNVFFSDNKASNLVMSNRSPQAIQQLLIGHLAQVYLLEPFRPRIIVIASDNQNWRPSFELMDTTYQTIDATPWLEAVTLKEALENVPPTVKPVSLPDSMDNTSFTVDEYYGKINRIRQDVLAFKEMATEDNPVLQEVEKNLYIAEGSDWTKVAENPNLVNAGSSYIDAIKKSIQNELAKITLPKEQTVTLTSKKGKIPISIINNSTNIYKVTLHFSGSNIEFPDGIDKSISLKPKENLIAVPVEIKKAKNSRINVSLKNDKVEISKSIISVKTTYISRMIIISLTLGLILTILIIIFITFRKRGRENA